MKSYVKPTGKYPAKKPNAPGEGSESAGPPTIQQKLVLLTLAFPRVRIVTAGVAPGLRRTRVPYKSESSGQHKARLAMQETHLTLPGSHDASFDDSRLLSFDDATLGSSADMERRTSRSRVCYALEPSAGNIGNRYWRT